MKNSISFVLFLAVALGSIFWFWTRSIGQESRQVQLSPEIVTYFQETMQREFISRRGQPIEGFYPELFVDIYPGLREEDFQGVRALQGTYIYVREKLDFQKDQNIQEHSAGRALAKEGMERLLRNVIARTQKNISSKEDVDTLLEDLSGVKASYIQPDARFAFTYFDGTYYLEERDSGSGQRIHKTIVLTRDTAENFRVRAGQEQGREGPLAITIDIYQNNLDKNTAERWIRNSSNSNFKLSPDEKLTPTKLGGRDALSYVWSGLYNGDSIVVADESWVYMFTVTYNDPNDEIRKDFRDLIDSVIFNF